MLVNATLFIDGKPKQIEVKITSSEYPDFHVKSLMLETFTMKKPFEGIDNVYLIRNDVTQRYKIGFSNNVPRRLKTFETGNDCKLTLLACCIGGKDVESFFHTKYKNNSHKGEWFTFNDQELIEIFEEFSHRRDVKEILKREFEAIDREALEKKKQIEDKFVVEAPKKIISLPNKDELNALTVNKLHEMRKSNNLTIKGSASMNKETLVNSIYEALNKKITLCNTVYTLESLNKLSLIELLELSHARDIITDSKDKQTLVNEIYKNLKF